ncbi:hypothetical protein D3C80_1474050 [compost metagenome]
MSFDERAPHGHFAKHARLQLRGRSRQLHRRRRATGHHHGQRLARGLQPGSPPANPPAQPNDPPHRPDRSRQALPVALRTDPGLRRRSRSRGQRRPRTPGRATESAHHDRHRPALRDRRHRPLPQDPPGRNLRPDHGQPRAGPARRGLRRVHRPRQRTAGFGFRLPAPGHHLQHRLRLAGLRQSQRLRTKTQRPAQPRLPAPGQPGDPAGKMGLRRP